MNQLTNYEGVCNVCNNLKSGLNLDDEMAVIFLKVSLVSFGLVVTHRVWAFVQPP